MEGFTRRASRDVYENPWLRFEVHEVVHPNGRPGEYGVVHVPPASAVVVIDGGDIVLTRQARYAVDRTVLEIVKGGRHPGEDALACARRETREELGIEARRWIPLGETLEIPSIVTGAVHLFLASQCVTGATSFEAVETIEAVRMPFDAAVRLALEGGIDDAVSIAGILRASEVRKRS